MLSRRSFSRFPAALAAATATSALAQTTPGTDLLGSSGLIAGAWNTMMTFSAPPPQPFPAAFPILETFFENGMIVSSAALPFTTAGHGSWARKGKNISSRVRLIILPQVVGVAVSVEIVETIILAADGNSYTGSFSALFSPQGTDSFTLTGTPAGQRIPAP